MEKNLIILFGAPGSGKGYLGDCIKQELLKRYENRLSEKDFAYISTGNLLREEIAAQTPLGKNIEQIVSAGKLVPDECVVKLVENALQGSEKIKILDGFPRSEMQVKALQSALKQNPHFTLVIKRDTPVSLIISRVSQRRICKECQMTHSVQDGKCPRCGGQSVIRKDDAVIKSRINEYILNTEPQWNQLIRIANVAVVKNGAEDGAVSAESIVSNFFYYSKF